MESFEKEIQEAIQNRILPGIHVAAVSKDGSLDYFKAFGNVGVEDGSPPISADTIMSMASSTKLPTCIAAMQVVEQGLVGLDEDVAEHLPELQKAIILEGFEDGDFKKPIMREPQTRITVRQMLSHTSGITGLEVEKIRNYYAGKGDSRATIFDRYFRAEDAEVKSKALGEIRDALNTLDLDPLSFEPGSDWVYGQGIDWAGQLVERLTHSTLEEFCQKHIFKPLGMQNTTYRLAKHPNGVQNLAKMTLRGPDGKIANTDSLYPIDGKVHLGGSNLFSSGPDYMKLLTSLLRNDGVLLKPETIDLMFNYRLPETGEFKGAKDSDDERKYIYRGLAPDNMKTDHCLAGMINLEDLMGGRKAGTVSWQGACGTFWWIDRQAGLCGYFGSQAMMITDKGITFDYVSKFETALYADHGSAT